VIGAVALGYPFHPPGKPEKTRTAHLQSLCKPLLIVQGERDTFGRREEVVDYELSNTIELRFLNDGDHSFKPRKASGETLEGHIDTTTQFTVRFIEERIQ